MPDYDILVETHVILRGLSSPPTVEEVRGYIEKQMTAGELKAKDFDLGGVQTLGKLLGHLKRLIERGELSPDEISKGEVKQK